MRFGGRSDDNTTCCLLLDGDGDGGIWIWTDGGSRREDAKSKVQGCLETRVESLVNLYL